MVPIMTLGPDKHTVLKTLLTIYFVTLLWNKNLKLHYSTLLTQHYLNIVLKY